MQGFHLVPAAFLRCLHDTRLQPSDLLVTFSPVNPVPTQLQAGGRTYCTSNHLPALL
ncbi:hypothetical protein BN874_2130004 [Candidatus Contendobacter odensis Run_B_J11]|uniref:Uncharacterized protein n=1 Tax=Candidatus Contendobacter odensis Run_B_J11 TaxID=1400861 RepID=A0A7U7GBA7_9GAMM|nr:hypothetical protein BN874_2130004 [Candidatus Contendobacter odensis Run_B_J11]